MKLTNFVFVKMKKEGTTLMARQSRLPLVRAGDIRAAVEQQLTGISDLELTGFATSQALIST